MKQEKSSPSSRQSNDQVKKRGLALCFNQSPSFIGMTIEITLTSNLIEYLNLTDSFTIMVFLYIFNYFSYKHSNTN